LGGRFVQLIHWLYRKATSASSLRHEPLLSPERRHFLTRAAVAVSATPFAACAYGLLYERTEIETTHQPINWNGSRKPLTGFASRKLSDIHIGPFMPVEDIRRCVETVNRLKPDLVVLTGDFVTWKASPEVAVVQALSPLKAPFGVYGCLGNHERWGGRGRLHHSPIHRAGRQILRYQNAAIDRVVSTEPHRRGLPDPRALCSARRGDRHNYSRELSPSSSRGR